MSATGRWARKAILLAWSLAPTVALAAQSPPVAPGDLPPAMADGRMLGHLPYPEVARTELVLAPTGFALGVPCLIHRDAAPDLARMLAAAGLTPGIGKSLRGVSCFRTIAHQRAVFCRGARPGVCIDPARRARFVGPPGYSEHATGYAIDFGIRPSPGCADVDACIAGTPAGKWLLAHAPEFGFELSFPSGNAQGVTWEPWHWRWVGASVNVGGAARARLTFSRARTNYPASPGVADVSDAWLTASSTPPQVVPPAVVLPPIPDPIEQRARRLRR
jgi:D-alanyl-D-alanine carboxypeptidase